MQSGPLLYLEQGVRDRPKKSVTEPHRCADSETKSWQRRMQRPRIELKKRPRRPKGALGGGESERTADGQCRAHLAGRPASDPGPVAGTHRDPPRSAGVAGPLHRARLPWRSSVVGRRRG